MDDDSIEEKRDKEREQMKQEYKRMRQEKVRGEKLSGSSTSKHSGFTNKKGDGLKLPPKEVRTSKMETEEEGSEVLYSQTDTPCGDAGALARSAHTSGSEAKDMSMTKGSKPSISDNARLCAKRELFKMIKFVNQKIHSPFCVDRDSVAGFVISFCNAGVTPTRDKAKEMWNIARPVVFKSITHLRNNCIKAIQKEYMSKFVCLT